ncbi:hypothetical protein ACCO45_007425 [Purpureocillium lilacinum]|uniref:Uncharacterized protein n=1 Tax=Purpureocillium lilacinum TaxID=33203 RepID=A0ACC4DT35_PURLI
MRLASGTQVRQTRHAPSFGPSHEIHKLDGGGNESSTRCGGSNGLWELDQGVASRLSWRTAPPFLDLSQGQLDGPKNVSSREMRAKGKYRLVSRKEKIEINLGLMLYLMPPSKEERRTLFFPTALIERIRDKHQESLNAKYGGASPLLTNGDILAGILVKSTVRSTGYEPYVAWQRVLTLSTVRGHHPALPPCQPYLHNALTFSTTRRVVHRGTPVSELALYHRLAIIEATKPAAIDCSLAITRELFYSRRPMHICEPFELSHIITNWCSAWRDIDFSCAAVTGANGDDCNVSSNAPLVFGHSLERNLPMRCRGSGSRAEWQNCA